MPDPITINARNVSEINLNSFKDTTTGALQKGKITIGSSVYNVSFEDGKVSVTRGNRFLYNLFHHNHSSEIRNRLLRNLTCADLIATQTVKVLKERFLQGHLNEQQQIIQYGLGAPRLAGDTALQKLNDSLSNNNGDKPLMGTNIDTYNLTIGIDEWHTGDFPTLIGSIRDGTVDKDIKPEQCVDVTVEQTRQDWKAFLMQNADRVDIFKKLQNYIDSANAKPLKKTGWAAEVRKFGVDKMLEAFILKNMDVGERQNYRDHIGYFVNVMKECLALNREGRLTSDAYTEILTRPREGRPRFFDGAFRELIGTAFFRQTSKLGLEFFRQKGIPVLFQWSRFDGKSAGTKAEQKVINDKWWLNGSKGSKFTKYSSITYSEMRHVARLEKRFKQSNVIKIQGSFENVRKGLREV